MIKKNSFRLTAFVLAISVTGCATVGKDYGTLVGCAAGTLVGAAAGAAIGGDAKSILIGAGTGALIGCGAGKLWQDQQQELEKIAKQENLKLQMETLYTATSDQSLSEKNTAGLVANVQSSEMFATNSSELTASGSRQIKSMAEVLSKSQKTGQDKQSAFMVIGHTDAEGTAEENQKLSELRARTVGKILSEAGADPSSIYYQGAGASRPIGENTNSEGQAKNRRVEIVKVANKEVLQQRIKMEESNVKYLAHGTRINKQPQADLVDLSPKKPIDSKKKRQTDVVAVDFGGELAGTNNWNPAGVMKPKTSGFQIISSAHANSLPAKSCYEDAARVSGQVKNLVTGAALTHYKTVDYLPGMNGRAWTDLVNGNQVTLAPVEVLKDNVQITQDPKVYLVKAEDYKKHNFDSPTVLTAVANAYEGEEEILYRAFVNSPEASLSCFDVVMNKNGGQSGDGKIFYKKMSNIFIATYKPSNTKSK